jgi:uncharacterized membrane protein
MNKALLVGLGILLLIVGFIVAFFAGGGLISGATPFNMFSHLYSYLIEVVIAIALMVVGGILVFFGSKKVLNPNSYNSIAIN